ncbi:MAG: hypothetical protein WC490_07980 [Candidatus Margulisiibacteriota bacterium]
MTETIVPVGGGLPANSPGATTKVLTIANEAVANFLKMMGARVETNGAAHTITVDSAVEDSIFDGGLNQDEMTKLGIQFTDNLFKLVDAGTVVNTDGNNSISETDAQAFLNNVKAYGELLGFDMSKEENIKTVAAMYNKAGVDFRVVNEADQKAVQDAAATLKTKGGDAATDGTSLKTWTDSAKDLAATQALARAVLGTKDADGEKLVNDLVSAWWTNILKKTGGTIEEKDLVSLWSFLSFWRNVPDSVLKEWGVTQDLSKYAAASTGITVVNEGMWNTWLSAAAPEMPEADPSSSVIPFTLTGTEPTSGTVGTAIALTITPVPGKILTVKFQIGSAGEQTVTVGTSNSYTITPSEAGDMKIWVECEGKKYKLDGTEISDTTNATVITIVDSPILITPDQASKAATLLIPKPTVGADDPLSAWRDSVVGKMRILIDPGYSWIGSLTDDELTGAMGRIQTTGENPQYVLTALFPEGIANVKVSSILDKLPQGLRDYYGRILFAMYDGVRKDGITEYTGENLNKEATLDKRQVENALKVLVQCMYLSTIPALPNLLSTDAPEDKPEGAYYAACEMGRNPFDPKPYITGGN